jgi:hypothetical protein
MAHDLNNTQLMVTCRAAGVTKHVDHSQLSVAAAIFGLDLYP